MMAVLLRSAVPLLLVLPLVAVSYRTASAEAAAGSLAWSAAWFLALAATLATARDQWGEWERHGILREAHLTATPLWRVVSRGPSRRLRELGDRLLPGLALPVVCLGLLGWSGPDVARGLVTVGVWTMAAVPWGLWTAARGWSSGVALVVPLVGGALAGVGWSGPGGGAEGLSGWMLAGLARWTPGGAMAVGLEPPGWAVALWWGLPLGLGLLASFGLGRR